MAFSKSEFKAIMEEFDMLNSKLDNIEDAIQTNREELHETRKLVTNNDPYTHLEWEDEQHFERQMKRSSYFKPPPPHSAYSHSYTSKEYFETPRSIVDLPHIDDFPSKSFGSILPPKEIDRHEVDLTKELLGTKDVKCYDNHSLEHDTSSCPQNEELIVLSSGVLEQVGEEEVEAYGLEEKSERVILKDPNKGDKDVEEVIIKDPIVGVDNEEEILKLVKECQAQHVYYDPFLEVFEEDTYVYLEDLSNSYKMKILIFIVILVLYDVKNRRLQTIEDPVFTFDPGGYLTFMIRGRIIFEEGGYDEIQPSLKMPNLLLVNLICIHEDPRVTPS